MLTFDTQTGYLRISITPEWRHRMRMITLIIQGTMLNQAVKYEFRSLMLYVWLGQHRDLYNHCLVAAYKKKAYEEWVLEPEDLDEMADIIFKPDYVVLSETNFTENINNFVETDFFADADTWEYFKAVQNPDESCEEFEKK